jgi:glycosyltransferase involved in cell wall biosynthesis
MKEGSGTGLHIGRPPSTSASSDAGSGGPAGQDAADLMEPLVTIGIPTFSRPELLARALGSVANQSYPNIEVLVADNGPTSQSVNLLVASFHDVLSDLRYVRHSKNIGALKNFMFLLSAAKGRYFMWLADDDEISENYVASLVEMLESDPGAASAAGHWMMMERESRGRIMPTTSYPQGSPLVRALRYIWQSDDAWFYALHRTDVLRRASFRGYWWPNRHVLWNWAYVYLLDVVLDGRIVIASDKSVLWINHGYITKTYPVPRRDLKELVRRACRRMNVHVLYWKKCAPRFGARWMPVVIGASIISLLHEGAVRTPRHVFRRLGHSNGNS